MKTLINQNNFEENLQFCKSIQKGDKVKIVNANNGGEYEEEVLCVQFTEALVHTNGDKWRRGVSIPVCNICFIDGTIAELHLGKIQKN